jgi:Fe-S oxidoreductase
MTPTRQVYFNIGHIWPMYAAFAGMLAVFFFGVWRRARLWKIGQPARRTLPVWPRIRSLLDRALAQRALVRRYRAGAFHALFFWGFLVLFLGTCVVFVHQDLGIHIMQGWFYLWFQSLALDIFGALAILGLLGVLAYRYLFRAPRLKPDRPVDAAIPLLFLLILVTGFVVEGLRIQLTADPWAAWSPVGNLTGEWLAHLMSLAQMRVLHRWLWWSHMAVSFLFLAWIPYSKLFHLFTSPANIYLRNLDPKGALAGIDMETAENLGVSRLEHFTWKDLFDLDSCTECGRCEINCPAFLTGKPLSPKKLILDLRAALHQQGPALIAASPQAAPAAGESPLVGPVIAPETLWSCTTCRACMEQCPVAIEQVPKIVGMRRHLAMELAELPEDLQAMLQSLETRGHPFPGNTASRTDWMEGLDVRQLADSPHEPFDVLFWVGCAGAMNARNREVTRSVARLLTRAGVRFAVLGREERCTGDVARRVGHEYLFETLARQNLDTFQRYGVKKIVTACPHCFNTLKNEYPALGADFTVVHHSELLADLVAQGKLRPRPEAAGAVAFHDPCYLGRYNDVYDAPRRLLDAAPAARRVEPEWNRQNALCCGGGGGFSFMEERQGSRMNHNRARQLLATGADKVAVGCPFCMSMLDDGIKSVAGDRHVALDDVAEILEEALPRE